MKALMKRDNQVSKAYKDADEEVQKIFEAEFSDYEVEFHGRSNSYDYLCLKKDGKSVSFNVWHNGQWKNDLKARVIPESRFDTEPRFDKQEKRDLAMRITNLIKKHL